jgi:hypothetical protein
MGTHHANVWRNVGARMRGQAGIKIRRCVLLFVILGVHLLLLSLVSVNDDRRLALRSGDPRGVLFFIDLPEPADTKSSTHSSSRRPASSDDLSRARRAARHNAITLPPEIEGTGADIDWEAEASRVARDAARRMGEEKPLRSLDQRPAGMSLPPPKPSRHKLGDSEHFEGGVIIDWISHRCYYSNQDAPVAAFGPALRLQIPTCTGAGAADSLQSFEDWKKEQADR